jgi:hypothetical protein
MLAFRASDLLCFLGTILLKLLRVNCIDQHVFRSIFVALVLFSTMKSLAAEQQIIDDTRAVKIKQYKWYGDTPKAKRIRVINPFGNITSRTSTSASIELSGALFS